MFLHIVCWKYKAETTQEEKERHLQMLRSLKDKIPNILSLQVGRDELHIERSFDTGLVATYPNREAYEFYAAHPEHQKVAEFGKKISEKAVSVDFHVQE
jgi:hypothetical protein